MNTLVIGESEIHIKDFTPEKLSVEETSRLKRLVSWRYDSSKASYALSRRYPHKVGRIKVQNVVYSVVPDMSAQDFTAFFLYSLGVRIDKFSNNHSSEIAAAYGNTHPDFRTLASILLILSAEEIAGGFLAKGYVNKKERLHTIRGRIDWREQHRSGRKVGLPCIFSEISIDNLLNQIVTAGLRAVQDVPIHAIFRSRLSEQLFSWSSIASNRHIKLTDLQLAEKSLNRLTEKYRSVIGLCRLIMFGYGPEDFFNPGTSDFQCLEFDLAMIFERFVLRLIQQHLEGSHLAVESQVRDRHGLKDGNGRTYYETRPDFLVKHAGVPIAVLDAKFKPRYVTQGEEGFNNSNKVSPADVYQLLFYAQRASQLASGKRVPAFILSPRIDDVSRLPEKAHRRVEWFNGEKSEASIDVIDVDISATIAAIRGNLELPSDGIASMCAELLEQSSPFSN